MTIVAEDNTIGGLMPSVAFISEPYFLECALFRVVQIFVPHADRGNSVAKEINEQKIVFSFLELYPSSERIDLTG